MRMHLESVLILWFGVLFSIFDFRFSCFIGWDVPAGDGGRTRNVKLGKLAFYR